MPNALIKRERLEAVIDEVVSYCAIDLKEIFNVRDTSIDLMAVLEPLLNHRAGSAHLLPQQLMAARCRVAAWAALPADNQEPDLRMVATLADALEKYIDSKSLDQQEGEMTLLLRELRTGQRTEKRRKFRRSADDIGGKTRNAYLKTIKSLSEALIGGLTGKYHKDAAAVLVALAGKVEAPVSAATLAKFLEDAAYLE